VSTVMARSLLEDASGLTAAELEKGRQLAASRAPKVKCGAKLRTAGEWNGRTCPNGAGSGTDHPGFGRCAQHGGRSPNGRKHAALLAAQAEVAARREAMRFYGRRVRIDAAPALLEEMERSVGIVRWLEDMIAEWNAAEARAVELASLDPAPDDTEDERAARLADRVAALVTGSDEDEDEDESRIYVGVERVHHLTGLPQLVSVHSTARALGFTDTEFAAWLKVYAQERRHLALVAKSCVDGNLQERAQAIVEQRAQMHAAMVRFTLEELQVSAGDAAVRAAMQRAGQRMMRELPAGITA
jgi:hypothetical protein